VRSDGNPVRGKVVKEKEAPATKIKAPKEGGILARIMGK
jgi:hypothetical protein